MKRNKMLMAVLVLVSTYLQAMGFWFWFDSLESSQYLENMVTLSQFVFSGVLVGFAVSVWVSRNER